jgi:hypothetical protein
VIASPAIAHLSVSEAIENLADVFASLLDVFLACGWKKRMEEFVRQNRELVATSEPVVNQDPWPLGLLRERVAVGLALEIREPDQPPLVAVECENVVFHGPALSRLTVDEASTDADLAAELVQCLLTLRASAVASDDGRNSLLSDANGRESGSHHVAEAVARPWI